MLSAYGRASLVIGLALLAAAAINVAPPKGHAVALPPVTHLIQGTDWRVIAKDQMPRIGIIEQQWRLIDPHGTIASLFVGTPVNAKLIVTWKGELGFEGEGYLTQRRFTSTVRLNNGRTVPIAVAVVQRGADREMVEYALVTPNTIVARGTDDLVHISWDMLSGGNGPYYVVRVATEAVTPDIAAQRTASRLLAPVITQLSMDAASGS